MNWEKIRATIKEKMEYYGGEIWQTVYHFAKWTLLSIFIGGFVGVISNNLSAYSSSPAG